MNYIVTEQNRNAQAGLFHRLTLQTVTQLSICIEINHGTDFCRKLLHFLSHIVYIIITPQCVLVQLENFFFQCHSCNQIIDTFFNRSFRVFVQGILFTAQIGNPIRMQHSFVSSLLRHFTARVVQALRRRMFEDTFKPCTGSRIPAYFQIQMITVTVHVVADKRSTRILYGGTRRNYHLYTYQLTSLLHSIHNRVIHRQLIAVIVIKTRMFGISRISPSLVQHQFSFLWQPFAHILYQFG